MGTGKGRKATDAPDAHFRRNIQTHDTMAGIGLHKNPVPAFMLVELEWPTPLQES